MTRSVAAGLWLGQDSAAAVFVEGALAGAAKQAWIDRVPGSGAFPSGALDAALDVAGARPSEVTVVGYAGLPPAAGRWQRLRRLVLGGAGANRPEALGSGLRHVRVAAAVPPGSVLSHDDLRRRCREARLPDVALIDVVEPVWTRSNLLQPSVRRALCQPGGMAVVAACVVSKREISDALPRWGPTIGERDAYRALSLAKLASEGMDDPLATALGLVEAGVVVAFGGGAMSFDDGDVSPRCWMWRAESGVRLRALCAPDGVVACSAGEVVHAYRAREGVPVGARTELVLGPYRTV